MKTKSLLLRWLSSLEKIGPYEQELPAEYKRASALKGERFNLQLLFSSPKMHNRKTKITVVSPLAKNITVREVGYVPVTFTGYCKCDDDVITSTGGVLADHLLPLQDGCTRIVIRQTKTLWVSIDLPEDIEAGIYPVQLKLEAYPDDCDESGLEQKTETFYTDEFKLEILDAVLPSQRLKVTEWFHCDSLASAYNCPVWSEEHWRIIGNFMKNAGQHGMNMILTPVLTPPLNVYPGTNRKITQLAEITKKGEKYIFDFSRLNRFVRMAQENGIRYFEIGHIFTQWGAAYGAPAEINGKVEFGWSTAGNAPEYREFLHQLLSALTAELEKLGIAQNTVFHCSDEPGIKHTDAYHDAISFLKQHLPGYRIIDAINRPDVYQKCGMDTPVPLTTDLHKFSRMKLPERWTYYCCAPTFKAPNRFIHFPSSRNRVFGLLLWKNHIDGFLHWGFNYYNEALSRFSIDPEKDSTSDRFYPPGDGFVVYPGANGEADDSIRNEVFFEALQDVRALDLLSNLISRKKTTSLLEKWCGHLTMLDYPRGSKNVLDVRRKINRMIQKKLKEKK